MKENYKQYYRIKLIYFLIGIISSILFCIGMFLIIYGAINIDLSLLFTGVSLVAIFFVVIPFSFILYSRLQVCKKTLNLILKEKMYDIQKIAETLNKSTKKIKKEVDILLTYHCLPKFIINENHNQIINLNNKKEKCPNCNSLLVEKNNRLICEYCDYIKY